MNRTRMKTVSGAFACAVAMILAGGCEPAPVSSTKTGATTAKVTKQDIVGYKFFDARTVIPPIAMATVYAPFKLPVSEVLTSVGKHVSKGDVILRLAVPEAKVLVQQALANVASAQSAYAASKGQNEGPLRDAARALSEAKAAEAAARRDAQSGVATDLEAAASARKDAEELYRQAKADFDTVMLPDRQALDAANQFLSEARAGAKATTVRAPISGTVMTLTATVGTEVGVQPKTAVATIVDLSAIEVHATVPAEEKDAIAVGTTVMITASDPGVGPIEGRVTVLRVTPPSGGQKSSTYTAAVSFDNSKGEVKPETVVRKVGVATGKAQNVLVVPMAAVSQNADRKMVVKVQKGADWVEVPVETGLSDGALIEIRSGLDEGMIVLVETTAPRV